METGTDSIRQGHWLFAATYDWLSQGFEQRLLGELRRSLVGAATGRVLEIGAGTGANFPYYEPALVETVVATEPDPHMLKRARRRAAEARVPIELQQAEAERLPFPDATFDTVVVTLVLCSVADQSRAMVEIRRVLKPGGSLRFIEHVRAPGGLGEKIQDVLTPLWRRLGAGCHLNRRTVGAVEAAGFEMSRLEQRRLPLPVHTLVLGVALRAR